MITNGRIATKWRGNTVSLQKNLARSKKVSLDFKFKTSRIFDLGSRWRSRFHAQADITSGEGDNAINLIGFTGLKVIKRGKRNSSYKFTSNDSRPEERYGQTEDVSEQSTAKKNLGPEGLGKLHEKIHKLYSSQVLLESYEGRQSGQVT